MKKTLLVLLLVILLTATLAVPANANEGNGANLVDPSSHCLCGANGTEAHIGDCDGTVLTWTAWTSTSTLPYEAGNYYLVNDVTLTTRYNTNDAVLASGETGTREVNIDLNGKTVTGAANRTIVLYSAGAVDIDLTITDSSQGHTGRLVGRGSQTPGGVIFLYRVTANAGHNMTLNIYRAAVDASGIGSTSVEGTAITVDSGHSLNLYNATVTGGRANIGGAVSLRGGSITMEGGKLVAGNVVGGGAVNMTKGTFTMRNSEDQTAVIDASGKTATTYGAAVHVNSFSGAGTFVMESGQILGGTVTGNAGGGAVFVQGQYASFYMNGGTISGGKLTNASSTKGGGSVRVGSSASFYMSGGTITGGEAANGCGGGFYLSEGCLLQLSGNAKITGNTGNDLFLATATDTSAAAVVTIGSGWIGNGENPMVVKMGSGTGRLAVAAENVTLTNTYTSYFSSADDHAIVLRNGCLDMDSTEHCLCGANAGEDHIGACDGTVLSWTAWNSASTLPTTTGNYYLTGNVALADTWRLGKTASVDVNIDLNGYTVISPATLRAMTVYREAGVATSVTITDSSVGHIGKLQSISTNTAWNGMLIYLYNNGSAPGTLNVYRATLDAFNAATGSDGGTIRVDGGHTLNLYGAQVLGGRATGTADNNKGGGAISVFGGTVHIADGSVVTGNTTAKNGGAILLGSGTVTVEASTVNGAAATNGGAVYMSGGSLVLKDATVNGADATWGGAFYIAGGTATMEGGRINAGNVSIAGGAIQLKGGNFIMSDSDDGQAVIDASGKTASNYGAAVSIDGNSGVSTFTMNGGQIIGGTAAGASGGGAMVIQGSISKNGIFVMNGGTISGGVAANDGGNVRVTLGGIMRMNGGTITGGKAGRNGGGVMVVDSAIEFTISGNARITGNRHTDVYLAAGKTLAIGNSWAGNGNAPMVVAVAGGVGKFTAAGNATAANAAHFASFIGGAIHVGTDGLYIQPVTYRIGYGDASIDPYVEQLPYLQLSGYGTNKTPTTIDTYGLYANCVAVSDEMGDTVLLLNVDLNYLDANQSTVARKRIFEATGVPVDNIMISAAHVHSAPFVHQDNGGGTAVTVTLADGTTRKMSYQDVVYEGLVAAAENAMADRALVTGVSIASTQANDNAQGNLFNVVRNYKAYDADGNFLGMKTDNHQSYAGTAAYLMPESEVDDALQLVKYEMAGKDPIILANFQTHPLLASTGSTTHITSDIVGVFREALAQMADCRVIYFSGAGGNVNPTGRGYTNDGWTKGLASARQYGTALATIANNVSYTALDSITKDVSVTARSLRPGAYYDTDFVKADGTVVPLATRRAVAQTIFDAGLSSYNQSYALSHGIYSYFHAKYIVQRISLAAGATRTINISAYSIGDVGFAAASYEMFNTNGLEIKNKVRTLLNEDGTAGQTLALPDNGFAVTFVATQANGTSGYIPSALGYFNGGYSVDVANVEAGTGELMVDAFMDMLSQLNPAESE